MLGLDETGTESSTRAVDEPSAQEILKTPLGPPFDEVLATPLETASAGGALRERIVFDSPERSADRAGAALDSLFVPVPSTDGTRLVLWIARDVSRECRLRDLYFDLARSVARDRTPREGRLTDTARRLAQVLDEGAVELWASLGERAGLERKARYTTGSQEPQPDPERLDWTPPFDREDFDWPTRDERPNQGIAIGVPLQESTHGGTGQGDTSVLFLVAHPGPEAAWSEEERRWVREIGALLGSIAADPLQGESLGQSGQRNNAEGKAIARGVAHDLKNLLVGILGGLELAFQRVDESSDTHANLNLVGSAAERIRELCESMSAYAGDVQGPSREFGLNETVRRTTAESSVPLSVETSSGMAPLHADPESVRLILTALLDNAREASTQAKPGSIRVRTGRAATDRLAERATEGSWPLPPRPESDAYQFVEITDRGHGIPADQLDRVFEPFFTTRSGARGLGLAAVLGLTESLAGSIQIRSTLDVGSTVTLYLPETCLRQ